ncbi:MAG TPA: alkaline phosphatase family protein [Rhizomicrobium sp.]|jgi:phospholipase C
MTDIKRRDFLQAAAAASALSAMGGPAAGAAVEGKAPGKLQDVDHFIILMKENRSFDHYFGALRGVRGFDDPAASRPDGSSVFRQPDPLSPDGHVLPFRLDTHKTNAQRYHALDHGWGPLHASWNNGAMDNWVPAHRESDGEIGPMTMGYHTRLDLPFYYELADGFTICDAYHCSVFGPTHPNRYYLMTGTNDPEGKAGGPALDNNGTVYSWETYAERLERAGISWRVYHEEDDYGCNMLRYFSQFQKAPRNSSLYENAMRDRPFYELLWDIRHGNIPQVTWIVPPSYLSEHPDYLPAAGENHTNQILQALWANPKLWAKTALILNYDENDGLFDHVAPPVPPPGTPLEYVGGLPIGLGFRVPCMVISPFSRGGYVSSTVFDHTSTLRLLESRFGVEIPNLSKWRRETCGDLAQAFGFGHAPRFDVPKLPETEHALRMAEERAMGLKRPVIPLAQVMPRQESGQRPKRA